MTVALHTCAVVCRVSPGVRFHDDVWFSAIIDGAAAFRLFGRQTAKIGFFVRRDSARDVAEVLAGLGGQQVTARIEAVNADWSRVELRATQAIFRTAQADLGVTLDRLRFEVRANILPGFLVGFLPHFEEV